MCNNQAGKNPRFRPRTRIYWVYVLDYVFGACWECTLLGKAKRTLREQGLSMKRKYYYNLQRRADKRTPEIQLRQAVESLKRKGFHVGFNENSWNGEDQRTRRIFEHFFFDNAAQLWSTRRFVSSPIISNWHSIQYQLVKASYLGVDDKKQAKQTVPWSLSVITSESAGGFAFMAQCMNEFFSLRRLLWAPASSLKILVRVCL